MQYYETIIISDPKVCDNPTTLHDYAEYCGALFTGASATVLPKMELLGVRPLSYILKGCNDGYYISVHYLAERSHVDIAESTLKADNNVLKFITFKSSEKEYLEATDAELVSIPKNTTTYKNKIRTNKDIDALDVLLGKDSYINNK